MRFDKGLFPKWFLLNRVNGTRTIQSNLGRQWRQICIVLLCGGLIGCGFGFDESEVPLGTLGHVQGFVGGVAVDEPWAALVGRDVLASGGTATDAAVAVYFAMAVTLPSSASLGGGGICVVRDSSSLKVETIDFLPLAPKVIPANASRLNGIPANARGFFALHAKYGRLKWGELLHPAENKARFGISVSRAFAVDLKLMEKELMSEPTTRKIFGKPDGSGVLDEGDILVQLELAAIIGRIRARGVGDFYMGPVAHELVEAVTAVGGSLSYDEFRTYIPAWRGTIEVPFKMNFRFHFPASLQSTGLIAAELTAMLVYENLFEDAAQEERNHLLVEASQRAQADGKRWSQDRSVAAANLSNFVSDEHIERLLASYRPDKHVFGGSDTGAPGVFPSDPSGASFAVIDREGNAVACALSMNNLFGIGRIAKGTGIVLSAAPGSDGRGRGSLAPMLLVHKLRSASYYASASSGGLAGMSAMVNVAAHTIMGTADDLETAIARRRVYQGAGGGITYFEDGMPPRVVSELSRRGHRVQAVPVLGFVNSVFCANGIPAKKLTCSIKSDPRGFGFAATAD